MPLNKGTVELKKRVRKIRNTIIRTGELQTEEHL